MAPWDFEQIAGVLNAVGMAAPRGERLDPAAFARESGEPRGVVEEVVGWLGANGLVVGGTEPRALTRAGSQYLARRGLVDPNVLGFLPGFVDDLNAREALIHAGTVQHDELRMAILDGDGAEHAAGLVPPAFAGALDEGIALDLLAASAALMARLSCGAPAGCTAEEILAVSLIEGAADWFGMQLDEGRIDAEDVEPGVAAVQGVFSLVEDDDVLDLFGMEEPADAAVAGDSWVNRQAGVVDQRLEAWFLPFAEVVGTGYLHEPPDPG